MISEISVRLVSSTRSFFTFTVSAGDLMVVDFDAGTFTDAAGFRAATDFGLGRATTTDGVTALLCFATICGSFVARTGSFWLMLTLFKLPALPTLDAGELVRLGPAIGFDSLPLDLCRRMCEFLPCLDANFMLHTGQVSFDSAVF